MKEIYTKPEVAVEEFATLDVVATSNIEQVNPNGGWDD